MWKDYPCVKEGKKALRKIIAKYGCNVRLDDGSGEDVNKNGICVLSSYQGIILDVLKIRVDDIRFSVRIKEAPGWTPSFSCDILKAGFENVDECGNFEEEGKFQYFHEKKMFHMIPLVFMKL